MSCNPVEGRSRRHVIRIAGMLGASAAVGLMTVKKSEAAGRHSDPYYCAPVCLVRGARIETATGEVAIENLQEGDLIRTAEGAFAKVRWIGHRSYTRTTGAEWPEIVAPVLVKADAIAAGVPTRDVYLSPKHALYIDGYLIPVMFLINGVSIVQGAYDADVVEYFHVECETHQVMFAEGLPVETFRLQDNYEAFANFADHERRFGAQSGPVDAFAPVLGYWTLREDVVALLRSIGSTCVDIRDPIHVAYDRLAERASELAGAHS